jgi:hypothetical protein
LTLCQSLIGILSAGCGEPVTIAMLL